MPSFMEPNYPVLVFLFAKKFLFFQAVFLLAVLRVFMARNWSQALSLVTVLMAGWLCIHLLGPGLGAYNLPFAPQTYAVINAMNGMAAPLAISALFCLSGMVPTPKWRLVDWLHLLALVGLLGLWGATSV